MRLLIRNAVNTCPQSGQTNIVLPLIRNDFNVLCAQFVTNALVVPRNTPTVCLQRFDVIEYDRHHQTRIGSVQSVAKAISADVFSSDMMANLSLFMTGLTHPVAFRTYIALMFAQLLRRSISKPNRFTQNFFDSMAHRSIGTEDVLRTGQMPQLR